MKLSQKKTCGWYDCGAGIYTGCRARADYGSHDFCSLGFKMKDGVPLEPCYKPLSMRELIEATELRRRG